MKRIKAFLVEDEKRSRELLSVMLHQYCPQVAVVGTAGSLQEALPLLKAETPDLVFLDVHLPDGNGFDLLHLLPNYRFEVIFTTAYEEFAVRALRKRALDYLLKPLDAEELQAAIHRFKKSRVPSPSTAPAEPRTAQNPATPLQIGLPSNRGVTFYPQRDIVRCEADGSYAQVFFNGGQQLLVSRNLKDLALSLDQQLFVRCHRKHLVNKLYVKEYIRGNGGYLIMKDGSIAAVSKRQKKVIAQQLLPRSR